MIRLRGVCDKKHYMYIVNLYVELHASSESHYEVLHYYNTNELNVLN